MEAQEPKGVSSEAVKGPGDKDLAVILMRLDALDLEMDEVLKVARSVKRYIIWTIIVSVGLVLLPLIGIVALLPFLFSTFTSMYNLNF